MISHTDTFNLTYRPTDVKIMHHSDGDDENSLLFITDYDKSCIRVYDLHTRILLSSLKTPSIPYYIEIANSHSEPSNTDPIKCCEIYVTCRSNTVHKFTISLGDDEFNISRKLENEKSNLKNKNQNKNLMKLCWTAGSPKEKFGADKFYFPRGLALVNDMMNENIKQLLVCNSGNNRIDCIDIESGLILKSFGCEKGDGNGKFDRPVGISNNGNELLIADHNNGIVQVFTLGGDFKRQFGTKGSELNCPRGICVMNRFCLITDNHRIQLFDIETGQLMYSIGSLEKGKENDQFSLPEGICFNEKTNEFLICDWENSRVQFFKLNQELL